MVKLIKFAAAVGLATAYELLRSAKPLWLAVLGRIPKVDPMTAALRLATCQECMIYHQGLNTCGYVFSKHRQPNGRPLGCLCFMPYKAKTECNCWIWEQRRDGMPVLGGWADELNSDYHATEKTQSD